MADRRISELSVIPAVAGDDALAIVDTSLSETNKVSVEDLLRSAPAGTAAAPSIAFVDDPDTGLSRSAANELSISTGGSERMRLDSDGRLSVGASSPLTNFGIDASTGIAPRLQVQGSTASNAHFAATRTSGGPSFFTLAWGSSGNVAADSQSLGRINFNGYDGTNYRNAAGISAQADGAHSSTETPGALLFSTTPSGSKTPAQRMLIDSAGNVGIGTSSPVAKVDIRAANDSTVQTNVLTVRNSGGASYAAAMSATSDGGAFIARGNATVQGEIQFATTDGSYGNYSERMRIKSDGVINFANCPTYADDTAAGTGGLAAGDVYKTSTGELRIKL